MSKPTRDQVWPALSMCQPVKLNFKPWSRTLGTCFLSNFVKIGLAVVEDKSKIGESIRGESNKRYKGRSVLASCQVFFFLGGGGKM